ncbi:hypothetical protein [Clostridium sp.]|nr:hypothetical protein [Clostridium sp.]
MNPLIQNRYAYGENNPIMNVDPSGNVPKWLSNKKTEVSNESTTIWK